MPRARNVPLLLLWAFVFVALVANAGLQFYNINHLIENDRRVNAAYEARERLSSFMANTALAESHVRGYVITGDPSYRKAYLSFDDDLARDYRAVARLMEPSEQTATDLGEMQILREVHAAWLADVIEARRHEGLESAMSLIQSGRGSALMDRIRQLVAKIDSQLDASIDAGTEIARVRYWEAIIGGAAGTILSVVMTAVALVLMIRQLTRQRQAEETAAISAERFRLLTETAPVPIWISSADGEFVFVNRSWRNYAGMELETPTAAKCLDLFHPDDCPRLEEVWSRSDGGSKEMYTDQVRFRRGVDQSYRWHRCAIVPVRSPQGTLQSWVGTLIDIHDQRNQAESLEQAVQLRTQELRRANNALHEEIVDRIRAEERVNTVARELRRSNEELEQFAYVASHDLQEPLRKIQAFGDRLLQKCRDQLDEPGRNYLDRMMSAATRMRTLIDDLLAFSRVASAARPYVPVDLNQTLEGVLVDLEASLNQSQGRVRAAPLPTVDADPMQMSQLLQNLIGNALKFHKPGEVPVVTIEAAPLSTVEPEADPPAPSFDGWRITLSDNGIGFDPAHGEKIFEVFQRLHPRDKYAGTGIGLAICRKIVERHGGLLRARGQPGVGAAFVVDLPAAPPAQLLAAS